MLESMTWWIAGPVGRMDGHGFAPLRGLGHLDDSGSTATQLVSRRARPCSISA